MLRVHLEKTSKTVKGITYNYYYISQSYRNEEGKTRKRRLERLGKLSDSEVNAYKTKILAFNSDPSVYLDPSQLELVDNKSYLDVSVISKIFDSIFPSNLFKEKTDRKQINTLETFKILSISRCLMPVAKYKTVDWFNSTYLPDIMNVDPLAYNKNKIFRELSSIDANRDVLQKHLVDISKNEDKNDVYFFDATTSFFEGSCCELASPAKDKTHGYQDHVILIFLVTNKLGQPLVWETFSGVKKEVKEFKKLAKKLCRKFDLKKVTLCFDRGMTSMDNFDLVNEELDSFFLSGLNNNQIEKVFDIQTFCQHTRSRLISKEVKKINGAVVPIDGFRRFSETTSYKDLGVSDRKRHVVAFNSEIQNVQNKNRDKRILQFKSFVSDLNIEYMNAKKDRSEETLTDKVKNYLNRNNIAKFVNFKIKPLKKLGDKHVFTTFEVLYEINDEALAKERLLDGVFVYITNHIEKTDDRFNVSAFDIVKHYKDKHVIEDTFRHVKSVLDLRPMHVWLPEHVKAHIDICMTACFINNFIKTRLKELNISLSRFYSLLDIYSKSSQIDIGNGDTISLLKKPSSELLKALKALDCLDIMKDNVLKGYGLQC